MIRNAIQNDIGDILSIYDDAILNTTAVYTYDPFDLEYAQQWYKKKVQDYWPVLVYEIDNKVAGFATFGSFRDWPAYQYTIEHSIYVHPNYRRQGIAMYLMKELINIAEARDYAVIVAGIDADNEGSLALHKKLGFNEVGLIKKAGYKFDRWLNLAFYQLSLPGPKNI
jgi:L-amino acid N-acyltransferase